MDANGDYKRFEELIQFYRTMRRDVPAHISKFEFFGAGSLNELSPVNTLQNSTDANFVILLPHIVALPVDVRAPTIAETTALRISTDDVHAGFATLTEWN